MVAFTQRILQALTIALVLVVASVFAVDSGPALSPIDRDHFYKSLFHMQTPTDDRRDTTMMYASQDYEHYQNLRPDLNLQSELHKHAMTGDTAIKFGEHKSGSFFNPKKTIYYTTVLHPNTELGRQLKLGENVADGSAPNDHPKWSEWPA